MPARVLGPILGTLGLTQIQYVTPVGRRSAKGLVAQVYRQVERDFGVLAPPVSLHAGAPPVLAAVWLMLRETLVVPGVLSRAAKEEIAAEVSRQNSCPYCATIHESMVRRSGPPGGAGRGGAEADAMALVMHYLNRMVNVFLRDVPLPPGVPRFLLRPVLGLLGTDMLDAAGRAHVPGASLDLLPPASLPADLGWLTGTQPAVAIARAAAAVEDAGQRALSQPARMSVLRGLSAWRGEPMGLDRRWTNELLAGLSDDEIALARLALLVAFASFQVDAGIIRDCRAAGADDQRLLAISAWSALAAARRMVAVERAIPQ